MLQRNEMFERLSPEQRQDVRAASQAVRQMPEDRQRMVRRAFNDLRQIPPEQRQAILNSARFVNTRIRRRSGTCWGVCCRLSLMSRR